MAELNDRIVPLDQLSDYQVAEGDPDVRGWDVIASDGRRIGEVDQLLVDTAAMKVRYLDVDVDDELVTDAGGEDRHVLIPIGYARLDEGGNHVIVDQMASTELTGLPAYMHGGLTRDFETTLKSRFDRPASAGTAAAASTPGSMPSSIPPATNTTTGFDSFAGSGKDETRDFYASDLYDENRFYGSRRNTGASTPRTGAEGEERLTLSEERLEVGTRQVEAGHVGVGKRVEEEVVSREVPVTREEVVVERRPASEGMSAAPRIEEGEIHVPITEEEVVVEKRVVPKEELVVKKQQVTDTETVQETVRREEPEIHREGDVRLRGDGAMGEVRRDDRI